jgi:uncharacterized small protein (DUF1192 family)
MRIITAVACVGVIVFIVGSAIRAADNPLRTTLAFRFTVEDPRPAEGYIVRAESIIYDEGQLVVPAVPDGTRVANGQTVAKVYSGAEELARVTEVRQLEARIALLESEVELDDAELDKLRRESVMALSRTVQGRDFASLPVAGDTIKSLILDGKSGETARDEIKSELSDLRERVKRLGSVGGTSVPSPKSGLFTTAIDGYESVTLGDITNATPDSLPDIFAEVGGAKSGLGKLVTGTEWYLAAVLSADDAAVLRSGSTVTVRLTQPYRTEFEMKVKSIGQQSSGRQLVILSCKRDMAQSLVLRRVTAELVISSYSGILVPKEALRLDDDGVTTYVYIYSGGRVERVKVAISGEYGEGYVVYPTRRNTDTGEIEEDHASLLREGAEVIVKANDLYDGKVIES